VNGPFVNGEVEMHPSGPVTAAAHDPMRLQPEDLAILGLECPTVVGHTCKIIRLAPEGLSADAVRERVQSRLAFVPVLSHRLGGPVDAPRWVPDRSFDLRRHVVAPETHGPLDDEGLRSVVGGIFAQHLKRDHPLWRMDVLALADGGTAIVWRLHHSLADGTTMMRWARELLWDDPDDPATVTMTAAAARVRAEAHAHGRPADLAGFVAREYARSRARSPFDGHIGTSREVGLAGLPLAALKRAAHALSGATVNDVLLAVLAGALRHYLEAHHGELSDLRVRVPVSLHHGSDTLANRDSFFSFGLPLHIADVAERLRVIQAETAVRKQAHDAEIEDELQHLLAGAVPVQRLVSRLNDSPRRFALSVSNVPGPKHPVSIAGVPVTELVALAEIGQRHGLRVAAVSLDDVFGLGFCADPVLVPGVQLMADAAVAEARRLIDAAGV
jgi:WS/DGAT/MGAT family acyltransferase